MWLKGKGDRPTFPEIYLGHQQNEILKELFLADFCKVLPEIIKFFFKLTTHTSRLVSLVIQPTGWR